MHPKNVCHGHYKLVCEHGKLQKALAQTLNDTKSAVKKLNQMANVVVGPIVSTLWLLTLSVATSHFFVFLSSLLGNVVFTKFAYDHARSI